MLQGKKILLGITGSIAAYKAILIVRLLAKAGVEVRVIMTPAAKDFVSPLVLGTLTGNRVLIEMFEEDSWANHVMLGRWADVFLIAPLSCNTLAKMASGQADNLLLATYLSATCPVVIAPAMDEDMWHHAATKRNLQMLEQFGNSVIPVDNGYLASGLTGDGRMAEPEHIISFIEEKIFAEKKLAGKKVLITAGPTHEAIDPVRFIANHSSGKMGYALASVCKQQGATVTLVTGPVQMAAPNGINVIHVTTAKEMFEATVNNFTSADVAILAAAVADYTPQQAAPEKIKKQGDTLQLQLVKTKDILKTLGSVKNEKQLVVGFALETFNEKIHALEKLQTKNADMIVLNSMRNEQAGFGYDTNKVIVFDKQGTEYASPLASKKEIASFIIDIIIKKMYEKV